MKRTLILIAAVVAFIVLTPVVLFVWLFFIGPMLHPPAPPLLQQVTAAGGYFGGCPPRNEEEAAERTRYGEALSPELNRQLSQQFPPGSPEQLLVQSLTEQGFRPIEPCQNDATVRRADFTGPVRGGLFEINAVVYWKAQDATLVWTKGFVSFRGF
jgi:hypothetical protein